MHPLRPLDVLVGFLACVAFFALCIGFMVALPDALPTTVLP
jgi:hypothetical protein